jgi:hypothetical protein
VDDQIPRNAITFNQVMLTFNAELEELAITLRGTNSPAQPKIRRLPPEQLTLRRSPCRR